MSKEEKTYSTKNIININIENPECKYCLAQDYKYRKDSMVLNYTDWKKDSDIEVSPYGKETYTYNFYCVDCGEEITMRFQLEVEPIKINTYGKNASE